MGETSLWQITPQVGSIAAASVTGTSAGTANTVVTCANDKRMVIIRSSLNQAVGITYNGVAFDQLEATDTGPLVLSLSENMLCLRAAGVIGVYAVGAAPTTGTLRIGTL